MTTYRHVQFSLANVVLLALPVIVCTVVLIGVNGPERLIPLGLMILFLGLATCFYDLKTEIDEERIRIAFGPGLLRKSWPLAECTSARITSPRFIDGWGVKLTREGWLYSVSMGQAVLIRLESGKAILIGTDEPEALLASLLEAGLDLDEST